jgi:hypothetical protein
MFSSPLLYYNATILRIFSQHLSFHSHISAFVSSRVHGLVVSYIPSPPYTPSSTDLLSTHHPQPSATYKLLPPLSPLLPFFLSLHPLHSLIPYPPILNLFLNFSPLKCEPINFFHMAHYYLVGYGGMTHGIQ